MKYVVKNHPLSCELLSQQLGVPVLELLSLQDGTSEIEIDSPSLTQQQRRKLEELLTAGRFLELE